MNLEKLFELVLKTPDNISIEYSNINGNEKLIVNGEDLTDEKESYDDSEIKNKIAEYKKNISYLDEWIWNLVIDEASKREYNLKEMNKGLNLKSFTAQDAHYANNVIKTMTEVIQDVLKQEVQSLTELMERF